MEESGDEVGGLEVDVGEDDGYWLGIFVGIVVDGEGLGLSEGQHEGIFDGGMVGVTDDGDTDGV